MGALIGTFDSWNEIGEYTIYTESATRARWAPLKTIRCNGIRRGAHLYRTIVLYSLRLLDPISHGICLVIISPDTWPECNSCISRHLRKHFSRWQSISPMSFPSSPPPYLPIHSNHHFFRAFNFLVTSNGSNGLSREDARNLPPPPPLRLIRVYIGR